MVARIPSLNWLRVFEAAARCESFSRAAAQLSMSPAAVSQQIKSLEVQLGAELFTRHAQAVKLTEAGRAYLPIVAQSMGVLEGATEGLFGHRARDQLYVHAVLLYAQGLLAPRMADFMAQASAEHDGPVFAFGYSNGANILASVMMALRMMSTPQVTGSRGDTMPKTFSTIAYVLLIVLMFGIVTGWLGAT